MFAVIRRHYHFDAKNGAEKPSLYDRLGGVYSIATVIDDFIDRIMVDPRLMPILIARRLQGSNTLSPRWSVGLRADHRNTPASRCMTHTPT
jgi:hypothetical protein